MKNIIPFTFLLLFLLGCQANKHFVSIDNNEYEVNRPPNMVKIGDNLYADQTEIRNSDWYEYTYWIGSMYGTDSQKYEDVLPDTTVWSGELSYSEPRISAYFKHPAFSNYPIVGVTYNQVKKYCEWRTDRVAEMILIQKGLLDPNDYKDIPFSIESVEKFEAEQNVFLPTFRLPTEEEWERMASGGLDISEHPNGVDESKLNNKKKSPHLFNVYITDLETEQSNITYITSPVQSYLPNNYKIYNTIGNVAEMVEESGISKGGSYSHPIEACKIENNIAYAKPEKWLGFRCVAFYEAVLFKAG